MCREQSVSHVRHVPSQGIRHGNLGEAAEHEEASGKAAMSAGYEKSSDLSPVYHANSKCVGSRSIPS